MLVEQQFDIKIPKSPRVGHHLRRCASWPRHALAIKGKTSTGWPLPWRTALRGDSHPASVDSEQTLLSPRRCECVEEWSAGN